MGRMLWQGSFWGVYPGIGEFITLAFTAGTSAFFISEYISYRITKTTSSNTYTAEELDKLLDAELYWFRGLMLAGFYMQMWYVIIDYAAWSVNIKYLHGLFYVVPVWALDFIFTKLECIKTKWAGILLWVSKNPIHALCIYNSWVIMIEFWGRQIVWVSENSWDLWFFDTVSLIWFLIKCFWFHVPYI